MVKNLWADGFVGISKERLSNTLVPAIEKYCETIKNSINAFNAETETTSTFKGDVADAVSKYLADAKIALQTYVDNMETETTIANKAYEQWESQASAVAGTVNSSAEEIRSAASSFRLD